MPQEPHASWKMRPMAAEEVDRISEIDVSESGQVVYKWINGRVEAAPERWHRPRSHSDAWKQKADRIKARLARGGAAFGAFAGERLVGFVALQHRLADDVALLSALWVSRDHRRQGIATALTREVLRLARETGATAVYVSACPSESAQGFYRSLGFSPAVFVHRELYEAEPEDIHMVKRL
jgi:ribosomal protein S18 acetylase RimI-like enzyme